MNEPGPALFSYAGPGFFIALLSTGKQQNDVLTGKQQNGFQTWQFWGVRAPPSQKIKLFGKLNFRTASAEMTGSLVIDDKKRTRKKPGFVIIRSRLLLAFIYLLILFF
jgi:hypothetical protein